MKKHLVPLSGLLATALLSSLMSLAGQRSPATITPSGGDFVLESCGFAPNSVYKILKNSADMNRGGRADAGGCVKTTFRGGIVSSGDNIVVEAAGKKTSDTVPKSGGGQQPQQGGQQPNRPAPSNPGPSHSETPVSTTKPVDLNKVKTTAENNARCMANSVVDHFGAMENERYNYQQGIMTGIATYKWQTLGDVDDTPEYQSGYRLGASQGGPAGYKDGKSAGISEGTSKGQAESRKRHFQALNSVTPPDLSVQIPEPSAGGLQANQPAIMSIEQRLSAVENEVQVWVGSRVYSYDGYRIENPWAADRWSAATLYQWGSYKFELIDSWYRDQWAFDLWKAQRYQKCANQVEYYRDISDASQTSNSYDAERVFRNEFKSEYDMVFNSKFRKAVMAPNPAAFGFGQMIGLKASKSYVKDLGVQNGFADQYSARSEQGKEETFDQAYADAFVNRNTVYQNNMMLEGLSAEISPVSGGAFGVGSAITVTVKSLQNIGRQPGEAKVTLAGNASQLGNSSIKMEYSKSLAQPVVLSGYGAVGVNGAPDQGSSVVVNLAGLSQTLNITMDWATTIRNLTTSAPQTREMILSYMLTHLKGEWEQVSKGLAGDNKYKANSITDTLLEKLVVVFASLPAPQQSVVKASVSQLQTVIGPQPKRWHLDDRPKWDAASALFSKLK